MGDNKTTVADIVAILDNVDQYSVNPFCPIEDSLYYHMGRVKGLLAYCKISHEKGREIITRINAIIEGLENFSTDPLSDDSINLYYQIGRIQGLVRMLSVWVNDDEDSN